MREIGVSLVLADIGLTFDAYVFTKTITVSEKSYVTTTSKVYETEWTYTSQKMDNIALVISIALIASNIRRYVMTRSPR